MIVVGGIPKEIKKYLAKDEFVERRFNLKGCRVYATSKRLLELAGRSVRDYDYNHISSISYTSKRNWWLIILGVIVLIAGIYFGSEIDETIIWVSIGFGSLLIILGALRKSERVEVSVIGVPETVKYRGRREDLDSLLQIVRQKRLAEPQAAVKTTKDTDFIETIRKLAQLRDEGIINQEEFEEKKSSILKDSE